MTEQRVRFQDAKPYEIVDSLDDLRGPTRGPLKLPVTLWWSGPHDTFEASDPEDRAMAYSAVLSNARRDEIGTYVNRDLLIKDWPRLTIDRRVVDLWSQAFPELAARGRTR